MGTKEKELVEEIELELIEGRIYDFDWVKRGSKIFDIMLSAER